GYVHFLLLALMWPASPSAVPSLLATSVCELSVLPVISDVLSSLGLARTAKLRTWTEDFRRHIVQRPAFAAVALSLVLATSLFCQEHHSKWQVGTIMAVAAHQA